MASQPLRITLADRTTLEVQPTLEDRLRFEQTLRRNRSWGPLSDNALKLVPFIAWSAATRSGQTALTWDEFTTGPTAALDVEEVEDDDADDDLEVDGLGEGTPTEASTSYPSHSA